MEKKIFNLSTATELSDKELSSVLFDGSHRVVGNLSQWAAANPARYQVARQLAKDHGRIGTTAHEKLVEVRDGWNKDAGPRQYAEETFLSRGRWPESVAKATLTDGKALTDLQRDDPRAYAQLILAATSYGLSTSKTEAQALARVRELNSTPEIKIEQTFIPSRDMVSRLGLPADERLSLDSFNAAICSLVKLEEADKAAAVSAKAKQEIEAEKGAA